MKLALIVLVALVVVCIGLVLMKYTKEHYANTCGLNSLLNDQFNESDDLYASYGTHHPLMCNWQNPSADWGIVRKQEKLQQLAQIAYANKLDYHTRKHTDHCNVEAARNFPCKGQCQT